MMAAKILHSLIALVDANGVPYSGAEQTICAATTSTPLVVYSDAALSTASDNPVVADSAGVIPLRYINPVSYKIITTTSAGVPLPRYSGDNIDPYVPIGSGALPVASGGTGSTTAGGARTNLGAAAESTVTSIASDVTTIQGQITTLQGLRWGQCRLAKSGSNLVLSPFNGNLLTINSVAQTIPDAGVSLAPSGVATGNLVYIYAYMVSTTMTLEYSSTGYATQAGTGVTIKSGDATRTLVGIAYATAGPVWVDSATQRFVRSWFNDPGVQLTSAFTTDRTLTATSYTEINSEIRIEWINWSGEIVHLVGTGLMTNDNNQSPQCSIGVDDATAEDVYAFANSGTNVYAPFSIPLWLSSLSEGYHYATLVGKSVANQNTYKGSATAGLRTTLKGYAKR